MSALVNKTILILVSAITLTSCGDVQREKEITKLKIELENEKAKTLKLRALAEQAQKEAIYQTEIAIKAAEDAQKQKALSLEALNKAELELLKCQANCK